MTAWINYRFDMKASSKRATTKEKKNQMPLRLDVVTKAQIELYSKTKGMSGNAFVTEAVTQFVRRVEDESGVRWTKYARFPDVPGYLECLMYLEKSGPFRWNEEEAARATFVLHHPQFFYHKRKPHTLYLQQLWPNLGRYMALWGEGKPAAAAAEAMTADLRALGLPVPEWSPMAVYDEDDDPGARQDH